MSQGQSIVTLGLIILMNKVMQNVVFGSQKFLYLRVTSDFILRSKDQMRRSPDHARNAP